MDKQSSKGPNHKQGNTALLQEDKESDTILLSPEENKEKHQALEITEEAREKEYQLPTFGGQLFMGNFAPQLLFPFPLQSEEDRKIGDAVIEPLMEYLKKNLDPEEVDAKREIPQKVIDEMARMGIFALKISKEYGGLGFSQTNYNRLVMQVASYCGSTAVLISAHQSIGVPQPLKMFGTEEQKKKFLPRFRTGSISAFALTEMDVGSDPAQMSSEAVLSEDGSHYILNGSKLWCTNGTIADVIIVMARTAPKIVKGKEKKQISAFILETNTPGFEVVQRCEFMGLGGIYNGLLKFTNVKIPKENLLWAEGRGLALALSTINVGRLTLPAACTGGAKQCLTIARLWGNKRIQWGMPVGQHEAGRAKVAYIAATTFAMEAITWLTSSWADEGKVDIRIEAAMAKLFCTEELWEIADKTVQFRGGRGYEKGRSLKARGEPAYPVERVMRDCRINRILEGSSEIMELFLAREAMDPHLKRAGGLLNPKNSSMEKLKLGGKLIGFYTKWYAKQLFGGWKSSSYQEMGALAPHFKFIEKTSHKLARKLFNAMAFYRQGLEKRQLLLARLVQIGTELFAMSATCSYAIAISSQNESAIDLANYFCTISRRRIDEHFSALSDNDDRATNHIAKQILNGEMTWLEKGVVKIE